MYQFSIIAIINHHQFMISVVQFRSPVGLGCFFIWRFWGRICFQDLPSCWQNSDPCIDLWSLVLQSLSAGKADSSLEHLHASHVALSIFKLETVCSYSYIKSFSLPLMPHLFCFQVEKFSCLKDLCDQTGHTRKIQDNLHILNLVTLIIFAKSLLSYNIKYSQSLGQGHHRVKEHYLAYNTRFLSFP